MGDSTSGFRLGYRPPAAQQGLELVVQGTGSIPTGTRPPEPRSLLAVQQLLLGSENVPGGPRPPPDTPEVNPSSSTGRKQAVHRAHVRVEIQKGVPATGGGMREPQACVKPRPASARNSRPSNGVSSPGASSRNASTKSNRPSSAVTRLRTDPMGVYPAEPRKVYNPQHRSRSTSKPSSARPRSATTRRSNKFAVVSTGPEIALTGHRAIRPKSAGVVRSTREHNLCGDKGRKGAGAGDYDEYTGQTGILRTKSAQAVQPAEYMERWQHMRSPHPPLPPEYVDDEMAKFPTARPMLEPREEPRAKPCKYEGEEETDMTILALKYKNEFKFKQPKPPEPKTVLLQALCKLMQEQGAKVHSAFLTIDLDKSGYVTEGECCMVFRTLGVPAERDVLRTVMKGLGLVPHHSKVSYRKLLPHLEGGAHDTLHHHNRSSSRRSQSSRLSVGGEEEEEQPNTEGQLARRIRRDWKTVSKAFQGRDQQRRGTMKDIEVQRVLVAHCSPIPMRQLRWLQNAFRRGKSDQVDYRALMAYFSPSEF